MPASTTSFLFPDINVWIALSFDGHVHHSIAADWFESLSPDSRFFFCRFTQLGLLRLLSSDVVMGGALVRNQIQAWGIYDDWLRDDRISLLEEPPELERLFRAHSRHKRPAPKDWADSYLSAFAAASNLSIVTFDRSLARKSSPSLLLTP
jgi:toxin-antitoxin system PIN domain toxin